MRRRPRRPTRPRSSTQGRASSDRFAGAGSSARPRRLMSRVDASADRTSACHARPARRADRRVRPGADGADRLAVLPGLVDADRLRHGALHRPRQFPRRSSGRPRSAAISRRRCCNTALYTAAVGRADPAAVGRVRPAGLPAARPRRHGCCAPILFSTYMVPMIAVALVWSKLYSPSEGPLNQMLGWVGLPPQPWLSSPDTALGLDRHPQRLAAGRLFHRARGRRADPDPGSALRGGEARRRRPAAAVRLRSRCRCCGARCCSAR